MIAKEDTEKSRYTLSRLFAYGPGPVQTTVDSPSLYLSTVSSVSTLLAMYGLLVLFRASKAQLATHSISPKFLVLQLVLIVQNFQRLVFDILGDDGVPPCLGSLGSGVRAHGRRALGRGVCLWWEGGRGGGGGGRGGGSVGWWSRELPAA